MQIKNRSNFQLHRPCLMWYFHLTRTPTPGTTSDESRMGVHMVEAPLSPTGCRAGRSVSTDRRKRFGLVSLPGLFTGWGAWHKRLIFCFLVLAAWAIGSIGHKGALLWTPGDISDEEPPRLDSFSQPAVASAILRNEANRLFRAYSQNATLNRSELAPVKAAGVMPVRHPWQNGFPRLPSHATSGGGALLKPLEQLRHNLGTLQTDLDAQLVGAYFNEGLWDQFLDSYLRFVQEAPDNPFVRIWAPAALDAAAKCNRSQELLAVLKSAVDFRQKSQSAEALRKILRDWTDAQPTPLPKQANEVTSEPSS